VLQEPDEQVEQLDDEEAFRRLEPPPMPNPEINFWTSGDPHAAQTTPFSFPTATRHSNLLPHFLQVNS
jgi:hypothetical protein